MQVYFDSQDAELELEALITESSAKADTQSQEQISGGRKFLDVIGLTVVLTIAAFLISAHLGSAVPVDSIVKTKKILEQVNFVIQIDPQKIIPEPKPKPKEEPKPEITRPKPRRTERLVQRRTPDRKLRRDNQKIETEKRETTKERDREFTEEEIVKRALPAVETPVIETQPDILQRDEAAEAIRYASVSGVADTIGGFRNVTQTTDSRELPEEDVLRTQLDPYHYQMVNVCLRLCVKSMFTHVGMSRAEKENSGGWLKVVKETDEYFSYLHKGKWVRFNVNSAYLNIISDVNFVKLPQMSTSNSDVNPLVEEVTRKLCKLFGYDDCFERL